MPLSTPRFTLDSIGIRSGVYETVSAVFFACLVLGVLNAPVSASALVLAGDRVAEQRPADLDVPRAAMPDVDMKAGALVTVDGRVLWARKPESKRAIASITKIMTAVVALEHSDPDEIVTVGRESLVIGESTSYLRVGQRLPMSEMLEALLIKSGNDASIALASHVAGDQDRFVELMNRKARELGLSQTHFSNAHGLDEPGHYSTARDLAVLTRYALSKPLFAQIVAKKRARIGSGKSAHEVENTNLLVGNYAGANGVKTGYTSDAGYSLIASASRSEVELIAVVLGTRSDLERIREARDLLDFGFAHYRPQQLATAGTVVGEAPLVDYLDRTVPAAISVDTTVPVLDFSGPISRSVNVSAVRAPLKQGDRVGVATFTQGGDVVATVALVATEDVEKPGILHRVGIAIARAWRRLIGVG